MASTEECSFINFDAITPAQLIILILIVSACCITPILIGLGVCFCLHQQRGAKKLLDDNDDHDEAQPLEKQQPQQQRALDASDDREAASEAPSDDDAVPEHMHMDMEQQSILRVVPGASHADHAAVVMHMDGDHMRHGEESRVGLASQDSMKTAATPTVDMVHQLLSPSKYARAHTLNIEGLDRHQVHAAQVTKLGIIDDNTNGGAQQKRFEEMVMSVTPKRNKVELQLSNHNVSNVTSLSDGMYENPDASPSGHGRHTVHKHYYVTPISPVPEHRAEATQPELMQPPSHHDNTQFL
eukprot:CAMPEP_0197040412 /NCGR_PEP_ID=MMETSP1384-20130603/17110_1 /TAXON_ID=29189 /ORGANISM="Ammonia sp." /LENGTH=296 /DNA_ID=CAMNT_0042471161 /DNA_START=67 /DNA_END=957 /DNA_ORIENTATION=-